MIKRRVSLSGVARQVEVMLPQGLLVVKTYMAGQCLPA